MKVIQDRFVHLMKKFVLMLLISKISSLIFKGFLCPICHRKFADTDRLEHHYLQAHAESDSAYNHQDTNGTKNSTKYEETEVKKNRNNKKDVNKKLICRIHITKLVYGNNNLLVLKKVECNVNNS